MEYSWACTWNTVSLRVSQDEGRYIKLLIVAGMMSTPKCFKKYNPRHLLVSTVVDAELKLIIFTSNLLTSNCFCL